LPLCRRAAEYRQIDREIDAAMCRGGPDHAA
jgi:hypothetical protein